MTDDSRGPFERFANDDVAALVAEYPMAWISAANGDPADASLLPLVGEYAADGRLTSLIGHFPRHTALAGRVRDDPRVLILFSGPGGYVSPEHAGRRNWAPTWNFAQLRIAATLVADDALTGESLDVLIDAMERDRPAPWRARELGERYAPLARRIIGFRATVTELLGRFKLGQDEAPETLRNILDRHPDAALVRWMRRLNPGRY